MVVSSIQGPLPAQPAFYLFLMTFQSCPEALKIHPIIPGLGSPPQLGQTGFFGPIGSAVA
jgi:hypothetical protein